MAEQGIVRCTCTHGGGGHAPPCPFWTPTREMWEAEREAKRAAINALMDIVEVGRWLANRQPAVHAKDKAEADAWAKFYKLLNEAPVSFQADLDAAVKRAQESASETGKAQ